MPPKRRTAELNSFEEPAPKRTALDLLDLSKYVQISEPVLAPRDLPPRQTSQREIAKSMAKMQNQVSNAPSSSSAADDSQDNYLYHVCVTLKNSNWSTIKEKTLYGMFGTRNEANEFAEREVIFPKWGHGPEGCSRWETRYDRFGLIGIAARVGEEQHNVIIRVERHNLKNPPPECPGGGYVRGGAVRAASI